MEIKSHKGWIFGDANSSQWTQVLINGRYKFQNPLRQNYKHIKSLQNILGYKDHYFKSLIAFSGEVEFKTALPNNVVCEGVDYLNFIMSHKVVLLTYEEIRLIIEKIISQRLSNAEHQAHIQKIKQQYNNADVNNPPDCPRCGNKMVLRKSTAVNSSGQPFWGCSRYPQCKAIVNIHQPSLISQIQELEKIFNYFF